MLFSEAIEDLQNLINKKVTQSEVAKVLNSTPVAINKRILRNSEIKLSELEILEKHYNVDLLNNTTGNANDIDGLYFPDVFGSCGTGTFVLSEICEKIKIPQTCFVEQVSKIKKYSVINARGNSMEPFIKDRDKLIVQHFDCGEQIADGKIYVFCYNDEIFVKRLSKNVNQLIIESDNKLFDTIKLEKEEINEVYIIGQIVGLWRDCRI